MNPAWATYDAPRSDCWHKSIVRGGVLRPLALSDVQTEEQAKQFYGRRVRRKEDGKIGTIGNYSLDSGGILADSISIMFAFIWRRDESDQYELLPDKPEFPGSTEASA
jgi:hypothetical protein